MGTVDRRISLLVPAALITVLAFGCGTDVDSSSDDDDGASGAGASGAAGPTSGVTSTTSTAAGAMCGDGVLGGSEACDGADIGNAEPCATCTASCTLDFSNCNTCMPDCTGSTCGSDGCGGTCGPCDSPDACCDGTCVQAAASCDCACECSLPSIPGCTGRTLTNTAHGKGCLELCQAAGCMGCGDAVSGTGDCPLDAECQ